MVRLDIKYNRNNFIRTLTPIDKASPIELLELSIGKCLISHLSELNIHPSISTDLRIIISGSCVRINYRAREFEKDILEAVNKCQILKMLRLEVKVKLY